ncbi:MAG: hypothetical protein IIV06_02490 [Alistipes sp.]|nr:hypothetical protein [Alistipes sp.]MBQ5637907.1 hypothetical protein [Alistipes sp.]
MEDIIIVVWIVMVAAGSLISAARKRKEAAEEAANEPQMPTITPPQIKLKRQTVPARKRSPIDLRPEEEGQASVVSVKTAKQTKVEEPKEEQSEFVREFDPEKAIIYSEIMRPKFQDWE